MWLVKSFAGKVHQPGPNCLPMEWQSEDSWFGGPAMALAPTGTGMSEVRRPVSDTNQCCSLECSAPVVMSWACYTLSPCSPPMIRERKTCWGSLIRVLTSLSTWLGRFLFIPCSLSLSLDCLCVFPSQSEHCGKDFKYNQLDVCSAVCFT